MPMTLFLGWQFFIIPIDITQIGIWIGWCTEGFTLKGDCADRKDVCHTMDNAIAVGFQRIAKELVHRTEGTGQCP